MQVTIRYGTTALSLTVPDSCRLDEYRCRPATATVTETSFLEQVARAERELFPLCTADLLIVNDAYRPTPTDRILSWLDSGGRLNPSANILIATGCHQAPTNEQLHVILGDMYDRLHDRVVIHDARRVDDMVAVGKDTDGGRVLVNRHFHDARRPALIGSVEPHYFAGFTGGRKSIFPGICDYETTARNHRRAVSFDAAPMRLDGNPVAEGLEQLMELVAGRPLFGIQIVGAVDTGLQAVICGELREAFERACDISRGMFENRITQLYDLVLAEVLPPLDSNLYQLQKSLENCQTAIRDGGAVILFSPCREGIGSEHFYNLAERYRAGGDGINDAFGIHKLVRVEKIGRRLDVFLHSTLDEGVAEHVFFSSIRNPQRVVNRVVETKPQVSFALVHDAGHTVLTMQ
ncbi:MAG: DUF2088 domain-containing protein [candidate division Zixibacteria bacterium]|nr:DUF2088 domain-containing protein [candidate division Zixibacteria bacterium]